MTALPELLLTIHLAATLFMVGVIWFVQVVHYPLFSALGRSEFPSHARQHAALLLFWIRPTDVSTWSLSIGVSLLSRRSAATRHQPSAVETPSDTMTDSSPGLSSTRLFTAAPRGEKALFVSRPSSRVTARR